MKYQSTCPYCDAEIHQDIIKCWSCGEDLDEEKKKKSENKEKRNTPSILNEPVADELRKRFSILSNKELLRIVYVDYSDYREDAIDIAKEEIINRGLKTPTNDKIELIKQSDKIPQGNLGSEVAAISGFGWGKLWLGLSYLQGFIAIIAGGVLGMRTEYLPNRPFSLIVGSILLIIAYGVDKRKKFGLYGVYCILILNAIVVSVLTITQRQQDQYFIVVFLATITIEILWLIYFYKRRKWFT